MRKHRTLRLREKVTILLFGASMLITVIMSIVFYRSSAETLKDNYRATISENLKGRASLFDSIMNEAYLTGIYAATDRTISGLIAQAEAPLDAADQEAEQKKSGESENGSYTALFMMLRQYMERSSNIQSIYCYLPKKDVLLQVADGSEQAVEGSEEIRSWINKISRQAESESPFSPVFNVDETSVIRRHLYTFRKGVRNAQDEETGILFVNVDERRIYFSCLESGHLDREELYITHGDQIVSTQSEKSLEQAFEQASRSILVRQNMSQTDYTMISSADETVITEGLKQNRRMGILFSIVLDALICFPILMLIRHLMKPLKELEQNMNCVKEGDFSVRAKIYREDEIGSISERFNEMVSQIEELIEELVRQRMLKKEAEIEALQYQITPHFMYNTLNSIKYAASLQNADNIAELLQSFTELLRISASDRGAFITVSQEIRMVQNYILLQQFRYENAFSAVYEIEPAAKELYVPRLLIQPLVENAIIHGLDLGKGGNRITISVRSKAGRLEIRTADNGSGMTQDEIDRVIGGQYRSKFSGIGIHNILERLHLYFGKEGTLEYQAQAGEGTTAVITLPAVSDPDAYTI